MPFQVMSGFNLVNTSIFVDFASRLRYTENSGLSMEESEECDMALSYKKLWKLLIDRDMKKKDLQKLAGISSASITKLGKNENVNTEIIEKICVALNCDVSDIMEMTEDK